MQGFCRLSKIRARLFARRHISAPIGAVRICRSKGQTAEKRKHALHKGNDALIIKK